MSLDAATTSSAGSPPPPIIGRRSFPAGFNPTVVKLLVSLVSLVPIVAFACMMMVVDNRNGERQLFATLLRYRASHGVTKSSQQGLWVYFAPLSTVSFTIKGQFLPHSSSMSPN